MLLATFCLRLAFGLLAALVLVLAFNVNPRFYRVQFLAALGLIAGALMLHLETESRWLWYTLELAAVICAIGAILSSLEGWPGGPWVVFLAIGITALALILQGAAQTGGLASARVVDDFTSAAVLGCATTGMLLGHSYLIAPSMSIKPLLYVIVGLLVALVVRFLVALVTLWLWTAQANSNALVADIQLWLLVRWGIGFVGPLILGWMAWESARIRSTQSTTGIMYVVVILCFLGELTSQLLYAKTNMLV